MYFNNIFRFTDINKDLKKKKNINLKPIIAIVIILIISITIIFLLPKNNKKIVNKKVDYYLTLNGNSDMILYAGSDYTETGFNAYDSEGNNYNDEVIINENINTSIAGNYVITYSFKDITKERNITIIPESNKKTILGLYGDSYMIVPVGSDFIDPGYYAIDSDYKSSEIKDKVQVEGTVDTFNKGTYKITYTLINNDGISYIKERTIVVTDADFTLDYNPKDETNNEITITGLISNNYYDYILLPNGLKETNRSITYKVTENNTYKFILYLKDGTLHEEEIVINNIDKESPTGTCKTTINEKTTINVITNNNDILKYSYIIDNNSYDSQNNTYTLDGLHRNVKVTMYDKAGNNTTISCETFDYSWPKIITPINETLEKPQHYNQKLTYKNLNYIIYYPNNLDLNEKNPLVVFLHGGGECNNNIRWMFNDNTAFANNMKSGKFKGAVFLAPQCDCSAENSWKYCTENVKKLIDKVVKEYNINEKRVSISCHSLGCTATYDLAEKYKNYFSAIALLAPSISTYDANKYKDFKTAVITGTKDGLHGINKGMVEYLQKKGANIKFIEIKGADHNIQPYAFDKMNTIEWMINQERK